MSGCSVSKSTGQRKSRGSRHELDRSEATARAGAAALGPGSAPGRHGKGDFRFPHRLVLRGPSSAELSTRFDDARRWIADLEGNGGDYRIVWRTVNHRQLGANRVPAEVWVDSLEQAARLIGRRRDVARFAELVDLTARRLPSLLPWLAKRPLRALALAEAWVRLLDVVAWLHANPRPEIFLRQVDLPGVHSKFIEEHRSTLSELLDLTLQPSAIDSVHSGVHGFCRRYGFRDKPKRVRLRILDPACAVAGLSEQDMTITEHAFANFLIPVRRVFVTENETNFLALPATERALVVFGAGYGFDVLEQARWLHACEVYYWGDIDTHGFAILDQFRSLFPRAHSLLMDRETLLAYRGLWVEESQPHGRELSRLTAGEQAVYDELRCDRLGHHVRLEQERIGYQWVERALATLGGR